MDMLKVARILKANGTEGEVLVSFRDILPEDIDTQGPVFIYMDGLPVPFFIESFKTKGRDKALMTLTGVGNLEDAEELAGKDVYVDASEYEDIESEEDFSALVGWTLLGADGSRAGVISGYEDIPGNPCIYVDTESGQYMIPLHEDLILSVDDSNREISMVIPEGLLDS
ncbi:MAG: ribosome maturation factor RimM [Candidatus Cryptobacteroides sp.]